MGQKYTTERYPRQYYISQVLLRNQNFLAAITVLRNSSWGIKDIYTLLKKYVGEDYQDKGYVNFLYVLLTKPKGVFAEYGNGILSVKTVRDLGYASKLKMQSVIEPGVYIKIFPYTTAKDITKNWGKIEKEVSYSRELNPLTFPWPVIKKQRSHKPTAIVGIMELNFKLKKKYGVHKTDGRRKADKHNIAKEISKKFGFGITHVKNTIKQYAWLEKYFIPPL